MKISVIIPTLNEAENIVNLLTWLFELEPRLEVIVVDGGSSDDTPAKADFWARLVIKAPRGRAAQMNAGAMAASGEVLWFLHADCIPHRSSVLAIQELMADPIIVGGAFEYNLNAPGLIFRITGVTSNLKNRLFRQFCGDMGIFVRTSLFRKMGGYRDIPLMEDIDFCQRLKKQGKIKILPYRIDTSARRWLEEGIWKNMIRNWLLQMAWKLGVAPETLTKWYKFGNKKP